MSRSTSLRYVLREYGIVGGNNAIGASLATEFGLPETHFTADLLAKYDKDALREFGISFGALGPEERKRVVLNWITPGAGEIPKW